MDLSQLNARLGDRYSIERELGRGGMGTVYLARDKRLDRLVAAPDRIDALERKYLNWSVGEWLSSDNRPRRKQPGLHGRRGALASEVPVSAIALFVHVPIAASTLARPKV